MTEVILAAWLLPLVLGCLITIGYVRSRNIPVCYPSELVIQITTVGNAETVNSIIQSIRGYDLQIPYRLWVVTEPGKAGYIGADEVLIVPSEFECQAKYKARALEFSRIIRQQRGLGGVDVKILFLDDDTLPTRGYILKAFYTDADLCEGYILPARNYGTLLSHIDDLRTVNCLAICSVFQGFGHPIWVHGEGLCVRASVEQDVTWNWPIFASEDFVFGQMAAARGYRWRWIREAIHITSPWTWRDLFTQRRRWLWGNIHAILHVVPVKAKLLNVGRRLIGIAAFVFSTVGVILSLVLGHLMFDGFVRTILIASFVLWLSVFGACGWMAGRKGRQAVIAAALAWLSGAVNILVMVVSLIQGNPKKFEVIRKTADG